MTCNFWQLFFSSLLYTLVAFRNSKKQLSQLEEEKFKSSCQFYGSIFFGKKKKVRDFILAQRTEGEGSIFFNNVGSPRELFIYYVRVFWDFSTPSTYPAMPERIYNSHKYGNGVSAMFTS